MRYTAQTITDSWSFSTPNGNDVLHVSSIRELRDAFDDWRAEVRQHSEEPVYLFVWKGHHKDVTSLYPDFRFAEGPRKGIIKELV